MVELVEPPQPRQLVARSVALVATDLGEYERLDGQEPRVLVAYCGVHGSGTTMCVAARPSASTDAASGAAISSSAIA